MTCVLLCQCNPVFSGSWKR